MSPVVPDPKELGRYLALGQVGLEMVAPIVVGLFIDRALGSAPWCLIGGAVFGLIGGLVHLVRLLNKMESRDSSPSDQESR
jgi:F0F1-type ATP synthase assembly protein I